MVKTLIFVALVLFFHQGISQQLSIPDLQRILGLSAEQVDTLLVNRKYHLSKKESDSVAALYNYTSVELLKDDIPVSIRAVTYMDVRTTQLSSRLLTYRTYSKEEYQRLLSWLLASGYKTSHKFDFGGEQHHLYELAGQTIRVKQIPHPLKNGRQITAYEFELGK